MGERCAVLLRGVNVGRAKRIAMADLRALLADVGCTDVSTYANSGNALVTADPDGLAGRVEAALPLVAAVIVVTLPELRAAVEQCPWPEQAEAAPKSVHVAYLPPDAGDLSRVAGRYGEDELQVGPRVLYLRFSGSSLDSPLTKVLQDLDVVLTARNWATARKLVELAAAPPLRRSAAEP